jgi:tetratricopeptide (TPR) repeat protein
VAIEETGDRVELALREAHVLRMRGQFAEAEARCREALEVEPENLGGIEMLADLLHDRGLLTEARDLYLRALEIQPGRASAETNLARVTLEVAERDQERAVAEALVLGGAISKGERKRRVTISLLLSLLFAGAGQLYNGEYVKGGILAAAGMAGLVLGGTELVRLALGLMGARTPGPPISEWQALIGIAGLAAWLYGLIDAPARANRLSQEGGGGLGID